MIADVFERHVLGADPFRIEALWRNVYGRGYTAPARRLADGRAQRDRDGAVGHRRQGGRQAGLRAARRQGARAAAQLHLSLSRRTRLARVFRQPGLFEPARGGRAGAEIRRSRASPRSSSIRPAPTRPSIRASRASSGWSSAKPSCKTLREAVGTRATCCSARTGSSPSRARSGSRAGSSPTSRCGSRSRPRPRRRRRWRRSRALPHADRDRRAADDQSTNSRACSRPAPPRSCS